MDLDRLQLVLRRRHIHESIDLGLAMARRWVGPLAATWAALVLPVWLLLTAVGLVAGQLWFTVLAVWWLRPLWARVPLFVLSRAIFGATPSVRTAASELPAVARRGLVADLTWLRASPWRTLLLPVSQLEGYAGQARGRRRRVLARGNEGTGALGLVMGCAAVEAVVSVGVFAFVWMLVPSTPALGTLTVDAFFDGTAPLWARLMPLLSWFVGVTVSETIYVAGGFSLYLNRRTALEGWDVELSFRRLARRLSGSMRRVGILLLAVGALALPGTSAQASEPGPQAVEAARDRVFSRDEFGSTTTETEWVRREVPAFEPWLPDWAKDGTLPFDVDLTNTWLTDVFDWLLTWEPSPTPVRVEHPPAPESSSWDFDIDASMVELGVWCFIGALLSGLGVAMWRARGQVVPAERLAAPRAQLSSGELRGPRAVEPPPPTVPQQVLRRFDTGDSDGALALLYASALAELAARRRLELEDAWTEGDCARAVHREVGGQAADYFQRVVRARLRVAYGHQAVDATELRTLCAQWHQLGDAA